MSFKEIEGALEAWAERGEAAAVATLVAVRRSAPRDPGARFAVSERGEIAGSVSSGCVEGDLHERLRGLLGGDEPGLVSYGISDEVAATVGLSCGGEIDVFLDRHDPGDPVWPALAAARFGGAAVVLVTGIAGPVRSRRVLVGPAGASGTLGDEAADARALALADRLLGRSGTARDAWAEPGPGGELFAESFAPPPRLAIVGATPIAEALCAFAVRDGFEVVIIDPRGAFAAPGRFPDARAVIDAWPDEALEEIEADRFTSVVVLTHDAKLDVPALERALAAGCGYVGLLGGGRTQTARREALRARGVSETDLARIHGPVGLDIGARTPTQIAVSILAELIAEGRAP